MTFVLRLLSLPILLDGFEIVGFEVLIAVVMKSTIFWEGARGSVVG
jgi:hypothetical protein